DLPLCWRTRFADLRLGGAVTMAQDLLNDLQPIDGERDDDRALCAGWGLEDELELVRSGETDFSHGGSRWSWAFCVHGISPASPPRRRRKFQTPRRSFGEIARPFRESRGG